MKQDQDPVFVERDEDECTITFEWATSLACVDDDVPSEVGSLVDQ
jgi:hypothetical protein